MFVDFIELDFVPLNIRMHSGGVYDHNFSNNVRKQLRLQQLFLKILLFKAFIDIRLFVLFKLVIVHNHL